MLDHNLRATLAGCATRAFHPQRSYLKLVSLGPKSALAQKGPLALEGRWMWRWKDHIDRRFMDKLQNLPPMAPARATTAMAPALAAELPQEQPLCGGCGSKVGPGALASALADLPAPPLSATLQGDGLLTGPGDDAAILRSASGYQVISTDHLRAVVEDPEVMARIALYHAMGDVWAMGAQPQLALAQIILPRMSDPLQARALGEITSASTAACAALGAVLAGGHSTMGAELTIGFTVTGTSSQPPILKAGAKPGDILLLTRPIGSGTLLAGEMQKQASGYWISALLNTLCTPQAREAAVLASMAHAMTDVTGFGLAGHALEMAQASGCGVVLDLDDIPLFPGASELSARGIRSTIHDANRAACLPWLESGTERCPLLHDPQTCGGLLAALEPRAAIEAVAQIAAAGGRAWSVGQITEGPARLRLR